MDRKEVTVDEKKFGTNCYKRHAYSCIMCWRCDDGKIFMLAVQQQQQQQLQRIKTSSAINAAANVTNTTINIGRAVSSLFDW